MAIGGNYRAEVLLDGPDHYWRCNDLSPGIAIQDSAPGGHYTIVAGSSNDCVPHSGLLGASNDYDGGLEFYQGVSFGGANGVAIGNCMQGVTNLTVEAWFQTSMPSNDPQVLAGFAGISEYVLLFVWGGQLSVFDWNTGLQRNSGVYVNDGQIHHAVVTCQSGVSNGTLVYLDGVLVMTTTVTFVSPGAFAIGCGGAIGTQPFHGVVDEVAAYSHILTAQRVARHYVAGTTNPLGGSVHTRIREGYEQLNSGLILPKFSALGRSMQSDSFGDVQWANAGEGDPLQPGFMVYTPTATASIPSGNGTIIATLSGGVFTFGNIPTGDVVWFRDPSTNQYIRGICPPPPSLGFTGTGTNFYGVALDLGPPSTPGGLAQWFTVFPNLLNIGSAQSTAALAAANQPAVAPGFIRVWDGIVGNSPGLVSGGSGANLIPAATGRDRRPWARGYRNKYDSTPTYATGSTGVVTPIDATNASFRCEIGAAGVIVCELHAGVFSTTSGSSFGAVGWFVDGAAATSAPGGASPECQIVNFAFAGAFTTQVLSVRHELNVGPGSHLVQAAWYASMSGGQMEITNNFQMTVNEIIGGYTNNGQA